MNLSDTSPYNADFDGDETNLHIPQSMETQAEVENIHMVNYDGMVRNSVGQLIQLRYGEDGLAREAVKFQQLKTITLSNSSFENKYKFDSSNEQQMRKLFTDEILREMVGQSEVVAELEREWQQLCNDMITYI